MSLLCILQFYFYFPLLSNSLLHLSAADLLQHVCINIVSTPPLCRHPKIPRLLATTFYGCEADSELTLYSIPIPPNPQQLHKSYVVREEELGQHRLLLDIQKGKSMICKGEEGCAPHAIFKVGDMVSLEDTGQGNIVLHAL